MRFYTTSKTGFTLMEILIVLIIVGILAALAAPRYGRTVERSRQAEAISVLGAMRGAQLRFAAENNGACTNNISNLDIVMPAGRFFDYTVVGTPVCNDADLTTEVARATRNNFQQTAGSSGYRLTVSENGNFTCVAGDDCAGGP